MDKNAVRVLAVLCGLIGLFLIGWSFFERKTEDILSGRGVHVSGEVRDRNISFRRDPRDQGALTKRGYFLDVAYLVGQGEQHRKFAVTPEAYEAHPAFSHVEVIYDPNNPQVARLGGDLNNPSSSLTLLVGSVVLLLGIVCAGWAYMMGRDERNEAPDLEEALRQANRMRGP